ncbi:hypothetical protein DPEC_G00009950 [Dallia pectoralis]|uniref:Uncharacterized protein n=1 Tax=Dallia pectoralis TaxID=75939 RepID=A0ACC2HLR4_DALPE|nr:hypothetical protein DPEC_G00009950 [Dallia pectoralis]
MELSCPICLQLYMDPVCLPCGHNFCRPCIQNAAAISSAEKTDLRCPECREGYGSKDTLRKNIKLSRIIEGYKGSVDKQDEPLNVLCDQCLDIEAPAIKTCLKCEVSMCARHLHRHSERESFQNHALVNPQTKFSSTGCAIHGRLLEYFCSTDSTAFCESCFMEGVHQDHDVLTIEAAEEEMRKTLESQSKEVANKLQMAETLLQKAEQEHGPSNLLGGKISKSLAQMDKMVELVSCYRDKISQLLKEDANEQKENCRSDLELLQEQQQQLKVANRSTTELLAVTDKVVFIQRFLMIKPQCQEVLKGAIATTTPKASHNTKKLLANLRTDDFKAEMAQLLHELNVLLNFLELKFNPDTAHPSLLLSMDGQTVKYSGSKHAYADSPERFSTAPQILCSQGFTSGEHTWVIEMGEHSMWSVGLCYNSLPRKGDHSRLGRNNVSWRLQWKNKKLSACHASSSVVLTETVKQPLRVEVALDYERGTLVFHSTKDRREHLYTFRAVFTEPVYPAFAIHSTTAQSWITLQSVM